MQVILPLFFEKLLSLKELFHYQIELIFQTVDNLVSSLDITSTILDYAGIEALPHMEGESLLPLINNNEVAWRDEIFLESLYTGRSNPFCEGIRNGSTHDGKLC